MGINVSDELGGEGRKVGGSLGVGDPRFYTGASYFASLSQTVRATEGGGCVEPFRFHYNSPNFG